jgi:hypothetical protein
MIMTPKQLRAKIRNLRETVPITAEFERALRSRRRSGNRPVWYTSQKQHWLGWLSEYDGPGYYGRKNRGRSAEFAYNHINCPPMVLWLGEASGVTKAKIVKAKQAAESARSTLPSQSAAIRRIIPWKIIEDRLDKGGMQGQKARREASKKTTGTRKLRALGHSPVQKPQCDGGGSC